MGGLEEGRELRAWWERVSDESELCEGRQQRERKKESDEDRDRGAARKRKVFEEIKDDRAREG